MHRSAPAHSSAGPTGCGRRRRTSSVVARPATSATIRLLGRGARSARGRHAQRRRRRRAGRRLSCAAPPTGALAARETGPAGPAAAGLAPCPDCASWQLWPGRAGSESRRSRCRRWDGRYWPRALSAEYGIGVRAGAFCAHPFVRRLTGVGAGCTGDAPAPVRASFGLGTTEEDVDRLVAAVDQLARRGAAWSYVDRDGEVVPDPDPRPRKSVSETWF